MLTGRKLTSTLALAVLVVLAFGASCKGFFVKPTLTTIAVSPPTPTITNATTNNTQQFAVVGTFDDGSHGSTPVTWSSSQPTTIASINSSGLATAIGLGSTTITAASTILPNISGTATLTVTLGCIASIDVTPHGATVRVGTPQPFTATATPCAGSGTGTTDITDIATWNSSNAAVATISSSGVATTLTQGTTNITAASGGVTSPAQVLNVGP
ncbi:MAG TPA: Ig-like domain-containing protein [Terriglobales bacterium]|nr:Ig-like domain-containing protein [Terriglobales bacterium]